MSPALRAHTLRPARTGHAVLTTVTPSTSQDGTHSWMINHNFAKSQGIEITQNVFSAHRELNANSVTER